LTIPDIYDIRNELSAKFDHPESRSGASDAVRVAIRSTVERLNKATNPVGVLEHIVVQPNVPWVVRVWAANVIWTDIPTSDVLAALVIGAEPSPRPASLYRDIEFELWRQSGGNLPPLEDLPTVRRRYSLTSQTAREELLGVAGFAASYEGKVAAAGEALINAAKNDDGITKIRSLFRNLCHVSGDQRHFATDTVDRAVVIAGALTPKKLGSCLDSSTRRRFASLYSNPGEDWPLHEEFDWTAFDGSELRRISPWWMWLEEARSMIEATSA
jgi:hypothetical protein